MSSFFLEKIWDKRAKRNLRFLCTHACHAWQALRKVLLLIFRKYRKRYFLHNQKKEPTFRGAQNSGYPKLLVVSPKSVVGRNRWILNKKMVKKSGNRVTFGCLIWYKTYFLYYLNFGPFTACFLYGPLVLSVRKQTSFHGLGTAKMAAFFRCEKRKRFLICSKFP